MSAEDDQYNIIEELLDIGEAIDEEDEKEDDYVKKIEDSITAIDDKDQVHDYFGINLRR